MYEPDLPPLPNDGPDVNTKSILDLYADELMDHATNIVSIPKLSGYAVALYKERIFEAVRLIRQDAQILRDVGFKVTPVAPKPNLLVRMAKYTGLLGVFGCFGFGYLFGLVFL